MKIICIGRNYHDHVKEMLNAVPDKPVFFMKNENALLYNSHTFFIPDFSNEIHYEAEIVLKIGKVGKNIPEKFALSYIDGATIGIDFTARDIQRHCIAEGEPWEIAKSFDYSAPFGEFVPNEEIPNWSNISFRLEKNKQVVQQGNSSQLIFSFQQVISYVSKFVTIKTGDLIFTGTPAGVGPVSIGDELECFFEEKPVLKIGIR